MFYTSILMVEELINTLILIEALKFKIIPCHKNYY